MSKQTFFDWLKEVVIKGAAFILFWLLFAAAVQQFFFGNPL